MLQFPRLIVHSRLASVTSLEILVRWIERGGRFRLDIDHFEPIFEKIVKHCHHLRISCLSFCVEHRHGHNLRDGPARLVSLCQASSSSWRVRSAMVSDEGVAIYYR